MVELFQQYHRTIGLINFIVQVFNERLDRVYIGMSILYSNCVVELFHLNHWTLDSRILLYNDHLQTVFNERLDRVYIGLSILYSICELGRLQVLQSSPYHHDCLHTQRLQ